MPKYAASVLAADPNVGTTELQATLNYLTEKLTNAAANDEPASFITYRTRWILERTLRLRRELKT